MISWWKILGAVLVLFALIGGLLMPVPQLPILNESIRNLYYHVPMWFAMISLLVGSMIQAIKYLSSHKPDHDLQSAAFARAGVFFGALGLVTGMIWAQHTWGTFWTNDPKLNSAAVGMLMYLAYLVLRGSIEDDEKKARVSAVYNIFSFPIFLVLIFVLPRLTDSLHPGNGGNPGFNQYDLDNRLRLVFYPAVIGWSLLGYWIANLAIRYKRLENAKLQL